MRHSRVSIAIAGAMALIFSACDKTPVAPTGPTVTVTDPAADAGAPLNGSPAPDLIGATLSVSQNAIAADVTFASGSLAQALTTVTIVFDTDESASTGTPGIDANGDDAAGFGSDYFVRCLSSQCEVRTGSGLTVTGTVSASYSGSSQMHVVIPLTMLGNDDGRLRFKVLVMQGSTGGATTGVLDVMPNVGTAAGILH